MDDGHKIQEIICTDGAWSKKINEGVVGSMREGMLWMIAPLQPYPLFPSPPQPQYE